MEKLYASKTLLEKADGWMYDLIQPLDPHLAISYRNYQKSLAYLSHQAPLVLLFFTKKQSQKERETRHNARLNTLLPRSLRLGACKRIVSSFNGG